MDCLQNWFLGRGFLDFKTIINPIHRSIFSAVDPVRNTISMSPQAMPNIEKLLRLYHTTCNNLNTEATWFTTREILVTFSGWTPLTGILTGHNLSLGPWILKSSALKSTPRLRTIELKAPIALKKSAALQTDVKILWISNILTCYWFSKHNTLP